MTMTAERTFRATKHNELAGYYWDRPVPVPDSDHYSVGMIEDAMRHRMFESVEYWGRVLEQEIG